MRLLRALATLALLTVAQVLQSQEQALRFEQLSVDQGLSQASVRCLVQDRQGYLWIGTEDGLNRYDGHGFRVFRANPKDPTSLSNSYIHELFVCREGDLWVACERGLNRYLPASESFVRYRANSGKEGTHAYTVRSLTEDIAGDIWVATDNLGLCRVDRHQSRLVCSNPCPKLDQPLFYAVQGDRAGRLWLGTERDGLCRLDPERDEVVYFRSQPETAGSLSHDSINTIYEDRSGRIWIGTEGGASNLFNPESGTFIRFESAHYLSKNTGGDCVRAICEDLDGRIWIGSNGGGLDRLEPSTGAVHHFQASSEPGALSRDRVLSILQDRTGVLWVGTFGGGLNRLLRNRQEMVHLHTEPDNPSSLSSNPHPPQVVLTGLQIANRPVTIGEPVGGRIILDTSIGTTDEIVLTYQDDVISFEYAGLHFVDPEENRYRYIMEGFDRSWNEVGGRRFATYTQLPAGSYTFKVDAVSCDGVWSREPAILRVRITPPFWSTWWFRLTCAVALLALLAVAFEARTISVTRHNRELERRVTDRTEQLEAANLELAEANKDLESFAFSISHDLRRPLRKLDGFSWMLLSKYQGVIDENGQELLQRIRDSSQQMARLIDDLLFFARTSRAEMYLNRVDLSAMAHEIAADLQETEPARQVDWTIAPDLFVVGDRRLLRIVLENLLGNAWKFTATRKPAVIELGVHEETWQETMIKPAKTMVCFVRDNGIGFNMAWSGKMFEPFQRLHKDDQFPGTGIGLATVQRIVQRHGGMIWAEGEENQGATLYFTLPM
jgi:signal transduction histidine kinase/streptogramin lyase